MPERVTAGASVRARYQWAADGTKLQVRDAAGANGYDYLGSLTLVRTNNTPVPEVSFDDGVIRGGQITYFERDHLGSIRASISAGGALLGRNDYYAFGGRHPGGGPLDPNNRLKFNGKEDQVTGALGLLDYGARMYDPTLARWQNVDPLAEKYLDVSGYAFTLNNPMNAIDPNGMDVWELDEEGNVRWFEESEEHTMYALDENYQRTNFSITVEDRAIFDQLEKEPDTRYNGHYATTTNKEDAFKVFQFAVDNTNVEWGLNGYEVDGQNNYLIRTSHNKDSRGRSADAVSNTNGSFNEFDMTFDMHSHPNNPYASGYNSSFPGDYSTMNLRQRRFEEADQPLPSYYIYHKPSQNVYQYTPWNPSIPVRGNMTTLKRMYTDEMEF